MKNNLNVLKTLLVSVWMLASLFTIGQDRPSKQIIKDKMEAQKVAYITQQLELTEDEAQKFWPIYNSYQNDLEQLKSSMDVKLNKNMSDKEAEDLMYKMLDTQTKEIEIKKANIKKMKTVISAKRIAALFRAERTFKEKIVSNIKERRRSKSGDE